jgi:hypothetical protein
MTQNPKTMHIHSDVFDDSEFLLEISPTRGEEPIRQLGPYVIKIIYPGSLPDVDPLETRGKIIVTFTAGELRARRTA